MRHMLKQTTIKKIEDGRCQYCKYHNKKCDLNLVPVKNELCYESDCFLEIKARR